MPCRPFPNPHRPSWSSLRTGRTENHDPRTCHQSSTGLARADIVDGCSRGLNSSAQSYEYSESDSTIIMNTQPSKYEGEIQMAINEAAIGNDNATLIGTTLTGERTIGAKSIEGKMGVPKTELSEE